MNYRTFRASTMREAMADVKATLGPDAVIVTTRELGRGRVELVAAVDLEPEPMPASDVMRGRAARQRGSVEHSAYADVANRVESMGASQYGASQHGASHYGADPELLRGLYTELSEMRRELARLKAERTLARRSNDQWDHLMEELKDLGRVMGLNAGGEGADAIVSRLVGGGVEPTLARAMVKEACAGLSEPQQRTWAVAESMQGAFEAAPAIWDRDRPTVAALVGPTGVGKTTTVAKIAAQAALTRGMKVAIVAADTYRIAAVDQVRTYSDLLGIPWALATNRDELQQALNRFSRKDLVLVDTAGGNPWRDSTLDETDALMAGLKVERHLCVPASASGSDLGRIVERYGTRGIRSLVITKMDEARRVGGVLSTVWGTDHQIAHITTGQEVPGDIETPDPTRLCQAVLG